MRKLILFLVVLFTASCAPAQDPPATPTTAKIYFYRLREFYAAEMKPSIFCDRVQMLRMRNGRFASVNLPPGEHTITSTLPGNGLILDLKAGETYYVRLAMTQPGLIHASRGEISQVQDAEGKYAISRLMIAEPEDVKLEQAGN
jgi:hypothetical protein